MADKQQPECMISKSSTQKLNDMNDKPTIAMPKDGNMIINLDGRIYFIRLLETNLDFENKEVLDGSKYLKIPFHKSITGNFKGTLLKEIQTNKDMGDNELNTISYLDSIYYGNGEIVNYDEYVDNHGGGEPLKLVFMEDLKSNAIKWIKAMKSKTFTDLPNAEKWFGAYTTFMEFFEISEKELK